MSVSPNAEIADLRMDGPPARSPNSDIQIAVLFFALWLTAIAVARALGWYPMALANYVGVGAVAAVALLVCRRAPLTGLIVVGALSALLASDFSQLEVAILPLVIAGFMATASGLHMAIAIPVGIGFAVITIVPVAQLFVYPQGSWSLAVSDFFTYYDPSSQALALAVVASALLLGRSIRRQRMAIDGLAEKNGELLRLRDVDMARAASEERAAVARDIHDVVAHHVAAMVIKAQAAERVADTKPHELRSAVSWIASSGQEALASMRQVVRVLSSSPPGLAEMTFRAEMTRLASRVVDTGVTVSTELDVDGVLTTDQEAAVIRITQEALTNVMLHSDASNVKIAVRSEADWVVVSIDDDGYAREALEAPSGGNGLQGMRDRVDRLGGTFRVGPVEPRGWSVQVRLPAATSVLT